MSDTMQEAQHRNRELLSAIKTAGEAALRLYEECDEAKSRLARSDADLNSACRELAEAKDALLSARARLAQIIGYCAQEGCDGEPYDTINAIATGEYSTRGGGTDSASVADRENERE